VLTSHKRTPATMRTITIVRTGISIILNYYITFHNKVANLSRQKYYTRFRKGYIIHTFGKEGHRMVTVIPFMC
jgi:hypothetical protein